MPIELIIILAVLALVYWLSASSDGTAAMHKMVVWLEKYVFSFDRLLRERRIEHEALAIADSTPQEDRKRHAATAKRAKHLLSAIYVVIATIILGFLAWIKFESWIGFFMYYGT